MEYMRYYHCDGGTLLIGNETIQASFPNGYGDGKFPVDLIDTEEKKKQFKKDYMKWKWLGTVTGEEINVYSYDCYRGSELKDKRHILYTVSGILSVYRHVDGGNMALEMWS